MYAQLIPKILLVILTFTLFEAAGSANYQSLPFKVDEKQLVSAKIMQRTGVLILPMVASSYICGVYSEYDQNVYLYGIFTSLNTALGVMVFVFHTSSNITVRDVLKKVWTKVILKQAV